MQPLKAVALALFVLLSILALTWVIVGNELQMYSFFALPFDK
jgi:hypothetical protein